MDLGSRPPDIDPGAVENAVENAHDRQILAVTQQSELSAREIIEATGIAQATVYRRLEQLKDNGLLEISGGGMREGHPVDLYSARVAMAGLRVEDGAVDAEWRLQERPDDRLHRLWTQLRES